MAGAPYNNLGKYLESRRSTAEKVKKKKSEEALKNAQTPGTVSRQNMLGYISQNGIDAQDSRTARDDYNALVNAANKMIAKNILKRSRKK